VRRPFKRERKREREKERKRKRERERERKQIKYNNTNLNHTPYVYLGYVKVVNTAVRFDGVTIFPRILRSSRVATNDDNLGSFFFKSNLGSKLTRTLH